MSRLAALLNELCPDGVEYKPLSELLSILDSQRQPVRKSDRISGPYPYYGANGIQDYVDDFLFEGSFILLGEDGSVLTEDNRPVTNWAEGKIWVNNHAHVLTQRNAFFDLRFAYYALTATDIRLFVSGGSRVKLNQSGLRAIPLPVPPLEVQQEIVRVLDAFTDLEQNLVVELELRKKQFGEYRKLAFQITDGIELRTLGEVSRQVISGATPKAGNKAYYEGGSIPWLRTSEVNFGEIWETEVKITEKALSETGVKWIPEDCLIVAISGASAGRSAINRIPTTTNQHCCCLDLDPETVDVRYAFHWTASKYSELKSRGRGARGDLNSRIIRDFEIPVPALAAQHEIAAELNAFESLIQSIEQEISLRRKQYEFYRDELLTFTPKGA